MIDWITGEKFIDIADHVYASDVRHPDDYNGLRNTLSLSKLKDLDIIYTHTFYAYDLFEELCDCDLHLKLITHNSDNNVQMHPPKCIVHWYAQNVAVDDPRVQAIPIGLENDRWFKNIRKKEKMERMMGTKKNFRNLLYINHNVQNFPTERKYVYDLFAGKPWVTTEARPNGKGFDEYLDNLYNHRYVACPRGNGMDTHRIWEALYMDTIPIVKRDRNNWFFNDFPILFVNDWGEVTQDLLWDMYPLLAGKWDRNKLTFKYWEDKIRNGR